MEQEAHRVQELGQLGVTIRILALGIKPLVDLECLSGLLQGGSYRPALIQLEAGTEQFACLALQLLALLGRQPLGGILSTGRP